MGTRYLSDLIGTFSEIFYIGKRPSLSYGNGLLTLNRQSANSESAELILQKLRGTPNSALTAITSGDTIGKIQGSGYAGSTGGYVVGAEIVIVNVGTISDNSTGVGGKIEIYTRESGGALTLAVTIDEKARTKLRALQETVQTISFSATPTIDASAGAIIDMTLTGNVTGVTVNNPVDGQKILWRLLQDGSGGHTFTFGSSFRFGTGLTSLTFDTTANKLNYVGTIYNAAAGKHDIVTAAMGY